LGGGCPGVSGAAGASTLTSTGVVVGTFGYMSPELLSGKAAGPASDVFALGCVLDFAATARPPFGDDLAAAVVFRVIIAPPDLDGLPDHDLHRLIISCLGKNPGDRPPVATILTALTGRIVAPTSPDRGASSIAALAADPVTSPHRPRPLERARRRWSPPRRSAPRRSSTW
jgi:serine/threonine protein kinase